MNSEEDLTKFIVEQRAKIAHDRHRLKNNPPSTISDNTVNRQILKVDKENLSPRGDITWSPMPIVQNPNPLPIQTTVRPPSTPRIFRLGDDYKKKKEKLKEELRADYRNAMAEKNLRTTGKKRADQDFALGTQMNSDLGLSLPLKDRLSAKVKDTSTETYEELLDRKRRQEKMYRGIDGDDVDLREKRKYLDSEEDEDDRYYRRVHFLGKGKKSIQRGRRSRRDDDNLDYDDEDHDYRSRRRRRRKRRDRRSRHFDSDDDSEYDSEKEQQYLRRKRNVFPDKKKPVLIEREATTGSLHVSKEKFETDDLRSKSAPPDQVYTGLPIGNVPSANTIQMRKEEYRVQLLQQMEEKKLSKKKERELDRQIGAFNTQANTNNNNMSSKDASPSKRLTAALAPTQDVDTKQSKKLSHKFQLPSSSEEEERFPRKSPYRGPHPRHPYFAPPMQPPIGYYPSPYDETYYYYGTRNPLDPTVVMPPPPHGSMYPGVSPIMAAALATGKAEQSDSPEDGRKSQEPSSTRYDKRRSLHKNESNLVASEKRDEEKKKQQMFAYQEELKVQIALKEKEKKLAKEEQEQYDLKMEEEARNYNPWGKGGGGAPMKDRQGNLISDLRQMHLENEEAVRDPTKAEEVVRERLPQTNMYKREERPVIDLSPRNPGQSDAAETNLFSPRFGRNNPFENRQSEEQKAQRDIYKEYLQKQIEEKQKLEAAKRERERIEEEKEERRLEEQRQKIKAELEAELEKDRNKKELARQQNEELRIQAEERKMEEHRKKIEEEEELRIRKDRELDEKLHVMARTKSPPVPAMQHHQPVQISTDPRSTCEIPQVVEENLNNQTQHPRRQRVARTPVIRTHRTESPPRSNTMPVATSRNETKRISRELSALRKQLLSEQRRVENQLRTVDLTVQPQIRKMNTEYLVDLSRAKQKPVTVRRPPTENGRPSSRALREFTDYKYRTDDTASIRMFRAEYPETPNDAKALERQQQALLARQGRNLDDLRHQNLMEQQTTEKKKDREYQGLIPPNVAQSRASLLDAETTYIPIVPEDDDPGYYIDSSRSSPPQSQDSRRPSASERRRLNKHPPSSTQSDRILPPRLRPDNFSLNSLNSLATLDVDRLANKNQGRLDKLRVIQGDEGSLADADDTLDRFVNKLKGGTRRHKTNEHAGPSGYKSSDPVAVQSFLTRPPSVNTVDTEPWLRPETGPTVA